MDRGRVDRRVGSMDRGRVDRSLGMSQMAVAVVAASVAVTVAVVRVSRGICISFSLGVRFSFSLAIVTVPVGGRGGVGGIWHRDSFLHQTVAPVDHCRRVVSLL